MSELVWPRSVALPRAEGGAKADPVAEALCTACRPWVLQSLAHRMRNEGADIPRRAEAEFSAALHYLVTMALEHGEKWWDAVDADLKSESGTPWPYMATAGFRGALSGISGRPV